MSFGTAATPGPADSRLPASQLIAFSLPSFTFALMLGPTSGILSGVYAKHFGLSLSFIATALLVCRLFDAVSDPVIGYLSDRTRSRIGSRKPWIIAGTALSMLAVYYLFSPPADVSAGYFMFWYLMAYLAWTMSEVPTSAWFTELTRDYAERARVVTWRNVSGILGGVAFAGVPLLPIFATSEMTPAVLRIVAWGVIATLPIAVTIALVFVPAGKSVATEENGSVRDLIRSLGKNRPFQVFAGVFLLGGLAAGMNGSLFFLYMDTYLEIGDKISPLLILSLLLTLASMPFWLAIVGRYGKQRAWACGSAVSLLLFPLVALLEPGPDAFVPYLILSGVIMLASGAIAIAPAAMLADIIDYDLLKSGANRAGSYFSVFTLLAKANVALGGSLAFFLIDFFGYDVAASVHDARSVFGMQLAYVFIPAALQVPAILLIWHFPIDERRQDIIRRRIEARALRAQRTPLPQRAQ